jgi:hypothetical protein
MFATKVCTKCGQEKPLKDFYSSKAGRYGKRADCKQCQIAYQMKRVNLPLVIKYRNDYNRNHPEYRDRHTWNIRMRVLKIVGECCVYCGESNPLVLTINHKDGGGKKERGGLDFYQSILTRSRRVDDLETACHNCNWIYETKVGRQHKHIRDIVEPLLVEYYERKQLH